MAHWTTLTMYLVVMSLLFHALVTIFAADVYTTCDFDLDGIESILPHLPTVCRQLHAERELNRELFELYMAEAQQYGVFQQKLDAYELSEANIDTLTVGAQGQYPFDAALRKYLYGKADLADCVATANETATQYLTCLMGKRAELTGMLPPDTP